MTVIDDAGIDEGGTTGFIQSNTVLTRAPLVPEIGLHLATEITPIWQATETWMAENNVEPPFWAFAWPGGQALARHILDHPDLAEGKRVLDFAAGGGIAAIACALAGATLVEAAEIDTLALTAIAMNAAVNRVSVTPVGDVVGAACRWDLILCGDVCYEAPMTGHIMPWLARMALSAEVWIADPGRAYLPTAGLERFAFYRIETTLELEDRTSRDVTLYRVVPKEVAPGGPVRRTTPTGQPPAMLFDECGTIIRSLNKGNGTAKHAEHANGDP